MPRPIVTSGSYQEPRGEGRNEWHSITDPVLREPREPRLAAPRRRRAAESGGRHERSVRQRALRELLESVLGDVSGGVLVDDAIDLDGRPN